mgnify:CR=1 FL=1
MKYDHRKRYYNWYDIVDTEEQAKKLVEMYNKSYTYYMRKTHPAHYTDWVDSNGTKKYVVWSKR